jgi:hypothetical protein
MEVPVGEKTESLFNEIKSKKFLSFAERFRHSDS